MFSARIFPETRLTFLSLQSKNNNKGYCVDQCYTEGGEKMERPAIQLGKLSSHKWGGKRATT